MQCTECQFESPPGARFCAGCGRPLPSACPACGAPLVAGGRFCAACGAAVGEAAAQAVVVAPDADAAPAPGALGALAGSELPKLVGAAPHERRQVTILFADLVGSTQLGEAMDPEDLAELINGAFHVMTQAVVGAGGHVARLMGDGLLAFFGAPISREDDPLRAVRAGLAIRDGIAAHGELLAASGGPQLACRVGIDTGVVVAGQVGGEEHGEYTTLGDSANTAARIQSAATPGEVWLSAETALLVERAVALEPLPPLTLKGKAAPVAAYRVVGPAPEDGASARGLAGIEVPLVGRDGELAQLVALFDDAVATRRVAWVTLMADAGIGKSRLTSEVVASITARAAPSVLQARALDPAADAFHLLRRLVAARYDDHPERAGIADDGSAAAERARLVAGVADDLRGASALDPVRAADDLARLLYGADGDAGDPAGRAERGLRALEALLVALAGRGPLVVVLEDLQWADDASLEAIPRLVDALAAEAALVLVNARPTLLVREPLWGEGEHLHRRLDLTPLPPAGTSRLAAALLGAEADGLPDELVTLFVERSEGNPFFVEELARMLLARGVVARGAAGVTLDVAALAADALPATLLGLLQARLDSLSALERMLLQRASVFGRTFWVGGLPAVGVEAATAEADLEQLRRGGLLAARARSMLPRERQMLFANAMLRDVAYQALLMRDRPLLHRAAADWLEARAGDRYPELAGLLGDHSAAAGRAAEAGRHYVAAGDRERQAYANARAAAYYTRALDHLSDDQTAHLTAALRGRELVLDRLGERERQSADLDALEALCGQPGGPDISYVHFRRSWLALRAAHYDEAEAHALAALDTASGDLHARADALVNLGNARRRLGRPAEAEACFLEALALHEAGGDDHGAATALVGAATAAQDRGDAAAARDRLERTLALYARLGDAGGQAAASTNLAVLLATVGDLDAAAPYFEQALLFNRAAGDRQGQATALNNLGYLAKERGDAHAAEARFREALTLLGALGNPAERADTLEELADVLQALGRPDEAAESRAERDALRGPPPAEALRADGAAGAP